ncbi:dehalogenase [Kocuria dechangensis]|uniref:Dehalogenase n=1 Tax=Kocuria dechangensis TaxID=1176249 RepID=A0A917LTD8_9MICC|nr:haloacid dehalogenase type II [Kocuria dechangensis]GGG55661.1 dehalogenase [Kocuria dechangensis]
MPTDAPRPLLVFDVNETLSDMRPLRGVFEELGVPGLLAETWFAAVLREGFALAVNGEARPFAELGRETARGLFALHRPDGDVDAAVQRVLDGVQALPVHADVPPGIEALVAAGYRLTALTNGSAATAEGLLERGGVGQHFEHVLSVENAPCWKPSSEAYSWAGGVWDVPLERTVMVAVHPWDLHGAARAGMRTAWIDRHGAPWPVYARTPDLRVSGVPQLLDRLTGGAPGLRD